MLDVERVAIEFASAGVVLSKQIARRDSNLADQIRRSTQSTALNLSEGLGRRTKRDKQHKLDIAIGECREAVMTARIAVACELVGESEAEHLIELGDRMGAMLYRLGQSLTR